MSEASGELERELMVLINTKCRENESNTPDYILARYLKECLRAFEFAVNMRDGWYGIKPSPGCKKALSEGGDAQSLNKAEGRREGEKE